MYCRLVQTNLPPLSKLTPLQIEVSNNYGRFCHRIVISQVTCMLSGYCHAGLPNLLCGVGNFGEVWSPCGQHKMQYIE